jgi:hypothetical protein
MIATTVDALRTNLIGAWALQYRAGRDRRVQCHLSRLGVDAQGIIIMDTRDGYMGLDAARANALTRTWR